MTSISTEARLLWGHIDGESWKCLFWWIIHLTLLTHFKVIDISTLWHSFIFLNIIYNCNNLDTLNTSKSSSHMLHIRLIIRKCLLGLICLKGLSLYYILHHRQQLEKSGQYKTEVEKSVISNRCVDAGSNQSFREFMYTHLSSLEN